MPSPVIDITVYDAPAAAAQGSCACGCGGHDHDHGHGGHHHDPLEKVSLELQTKALALTLEAAFPGRVSVTYINVLKDPRGPRLPQTSLLCSLIYPTPLIYINGKGRFAGGLPVERIREAVAQELQADAVH